MDPVLDKLFKQNVHEMSLPNGFRTYCQEDHSASLCSVQLWVKTGSIYEDAFLGTGISHFVEHMLFKGTAKRHYSQISDDVQRSGGTINAYTSFDRTVYYIDGPSEAVAEYLEILQDIVLESTFPEEEFTSERDVILREIDMGLDDPDRKVSQAVFSTAFQRHPYAFPVIGHRNLFEGISRDDLWAYYRQRYVINNMFLVVAGDVKADTLQALVAERFAAYERARVPAVDVLTEPKQMVVREEHMTGDYQVLRGSLCWQIPGFMHEDAAALQVLGHLLGNGESSLLNKELKLKRSLVHSIYVSPWNPGEVGLFWVQYSCDEEKSAEVVAAIYEVLAELMSGGVASEELSRIIRQLTVAEVNSRKTFAGQAGRVGMQAFLLGGQGYSREFFAKVQQVSSEDLVAVAQRYLRASCHTLVTLSSGEKGAVGVDAQAVPQPLSWEYHTLSNGLRVCLIQQDTLPKVHVRLSALGGLLYESVGQRGLTSLVATLLTKDTEQDDALTVAQKIEALGGSFYESVGNNTFGLALEVLSDDLEEALPLLANAVQCPAFTEETFVRERDIQVAQIQEELDEIFEVGRRSLREHFFGDFAYGTDPYGNWEDLQQWTVADCRAQWQRLNVVDNWTLVVCGDFDAANILPMLEAAFCAMPSGDFVVQRPEFAGLTEAKDIQVPMDREQAVVFSAYADKGILAEDYYLGEVLDECFSGMSSRLFLEVREKKGLAYYVGSMRLLGLTTGMFSFYAGTHPQHAQEVLAEFEGEVQRVLREGLGEEELARCKQRLLMRKRKSLQSISSLAMQFATQMLYGLPQERWTHYDERIGAISEEMVRDYAQQIFATEKRVSLSVSGEGEVVRSE